MVNEPEICSFFGDFLMFLHVFLANSHGFRVFFNVFWLSKWQSFHICALWDLKMVAANLKKIFAANERELFDRITGFRN